MLTVKVRKLFLSYDNEGLYFNNFNLFILLETGINIVLHCVPHEHFQKGGGEKKPSSEQRPY